MCISSKLYGADDHIILPETNTDMTFDEDDIDVFLGFTAKDVAAAAQDKNKLLME